MKHSFENNTLVLDFKGRIDSDNAAKTEKEIFDIVDEIGLENIHHVIVDAQNLEYISSAGLRVVLKIKKNFDSTMIINTTSEVYEIFEMTGFTDIISVKRAFRKVSVEGCKKLGEGGFGITYQLDNDSIVKIYKQGVPFDDVIRERESAKAAFISGVPTAIAFDTVRCGELYGTVYEMINAKPMCDVLNENPDSLDEYAKKTADLLKLLGSIQAPENKFYTYAEVAHKSVDAFNAFWETEKGISGKKVFTDEQLSLSHKLFDIVPERKSLIHGDIHTRNIFVRDGELILIDMADTSTGHPIFEFANMYALIYVAKSQGNESCLKFMGVPGKIAEDLFYKIIDYYFADFTEEEKSEIVYLSKIYNVYRRDYAAMRFIKDIPEQYSKKFLEDEVRFLDEMFFSKKEEVFEKIKRLTAKF